MSKVGVNKKKYLEYSIVGVYLYSRYCVYYIFFCFIPFVLFSLFLSFLYSCILSSELRSTSSPPLVFVEVRLGVVLDA